MMAKFNHKNSEYLSEAEEDPENEVLDEEDEFETPEEIGISLNLSKKNLKEFPNWFLGKIRNVRYLYLEGNKLSKLPTDFFQETPSLKWLDLRNNLIDDLPTLGLKNHLCLEVILLQGNKIKNLPVELASISSLKGLQTTGNPITNIPPNVMAEGFLGIMKHLKKLSSQKEVMLSVSETISVKPSTSKDETTGRELIEPTNSELRMWDLNKLSQWRQFMKRKSKTSKKSEFKSYELKKSQNNSEQPKISVSFRSQRKMSCRRDPFRCGVYSRNKHKSSSSTLNFVKLRKNRLGYRRKPITIGMIQEKARKEAWKAQLRETLEKQARKIQRMRDKEVLKSWREHAKITKEQLKLLDNYQQYPSKDYADKTPFDIDPEFLKMLNRADLYRSLKDYNNKSKKSRKPKVRLTALDLEKQMNDIMTKLQQLDTNDDDEQSPRTKKSHVCNKMHKILDIQKTLRDLQTLNSSMNGLLPNNKQRTSD